MKSLLDASDTKALMQAGPDLIPRVHAICLYGHFSDALRHLNQRLICTNDPQQIRGGGLLKYCHLRTIGFKPVSDRTVETLESNMSTRFVIDFPLPEDQYWKIDRFLSTHFPPPSKLANALKFLNVLKEAVSRCRLGSHQELTMGIVNQIYSKVLSSLPRPSLLPTPVFSAPPNYQQGPTFSVYFVNLGHYHHSQPPPGIAWPPRPPQPPPRTSWSPRHPQPPPGTSRHSAPQNHRSGQCGRPKVRTRNYVVAKNTGDSPP